MNLPAAIVNSISVLVLALLSVSVVVVVRNLEGVAP